MKFKRTILFASIMSMAITGTAFAGTWKNGAAPNQNKWWYDFGNGTFAANGWQWIDGDNNGIAECYYFDAEGWMLAGATTPDGYTVNESGAWTVNGIIQTKPVETQHTESKPAESQAPSNNTTTQNDQYSLPEGYRVATEEEWQAYLEEQSKDPNTIIVTTPEEREAIEKQLEMNDKLIDPNNQGSDYGLILQ